METTALHITGLLALLGTFLYAIGDVLLLAGKASLDDHPRLKPFASFSQILKRWLSSQPTV